MLDAAFAKRQHGGMNAHPLTVYRKRRGISQDEIAKRVGVTRWTITSIETGRRTPSFGLVAKLIEASRGELNANDFVSAHLERGAA